MLAMGSFKAPAAVSEVFSMKIGRSYGRREIAERGSLHNAQMAKTYTLVIIITRGII